MTDNPNTTILPEAPDGELPPGTELSGGMYRIKRVIASGGFGITYLAEDNLHRDVAIKECFPLGLAARAGGRVVSAAASSTIEPFETARSLFLREARLLANLQHPNVVHVQTMFEENGTAYMAMDFIHGEDLYEVIKTRSHELTPPRVLELTKTMVAALKYLHDRDLLHRDIKPSNIRINEFGIPILIDFGAARQDTQQKSRIAGSFRVVSDGYSPPEFYASGPGGPAQGPPSDLYSLAASIYHMITGKAPARADIRSQQVATGEPDPHEPLSGRFDEYDPRFLDLIDRAMALSMGGRPENAAAWQTELAQMTPRDVVEPMPGTGVIPPTRVHEQPVQPPPPPPQPSKFWQGAVAGGAALAILGGGAMALGVLPDSWFGNGGTGTSGADRAEISRLERNLERATEARDTARARVAEIEQQLTAMRAARDEAEERAEDLEERLTATDQAGTAAAGDVLRLERQIASLETARDAAETRAEDLQRRLDTVAGAGATTATEILQLEREIENLRLQLSMAEQRAEQLQTRLNEGGTGGDPEQLARLQRELNDANAQVEALTAENSRLQVQIDVMASQIDLLLQQRGQGSQQQQQQQTTPLSAGCPNFDQTGVIFDRTGEDLFTPDAFSTLAGGTVDISNCPDLPAGTVGFAQTTPNFTFFISEAQPYQRLELEVQSDCDTTLLVNTATASWLFNDDFGSLLPVLNINGNQQFEGRVDIWVGTYGPEQCPATIEVQTWFN